MKRRLNYGHFAARCCALVVGLTLSACGGIEQGETPEGERGALGKADVAMSCGGIAGLLCPTGYECELHGRYPDAMGTCRKQSCGGFTGQQCPTGFKCVYDSAVSTLGTCIDTRKCAMVPVKDCGSRSDCKVVEQHMWPQGVRKNCAPKDCTDYSVAECGKHSECHVITIETYPPQDVCATKPKPAKCEDITDPQLCKQRSDCTGVIRHGWPSQFECVTTPVAQSCDPQDAGGQGLCAMFIGYAWDGQACRGFSGCSCVGKDCAKVFLSQNACETHYKKCLAPKPKCYVGGCSGQLCTDKPGMVSTCEWLPHYACYKKSQCGNFGPNGSCGWKKTPDFVQCLTNGGLQP